MKKFTALFLILVLMLNLAGCGMKAEKDIYRTDTVIYIPAEPTAAEAVAEAEPESTEAEESESTQVAETETTAEAESETTEETVPETTKPTGTKKPASSGSGKKPSSATKPTEAPTTAPTAASTEATTVPAEETTVEATTEATTEPVETEPPVYDISGYSVGGLETAMMDEINRCRTAEGLGELGKNSRLCAIASARAYEASLSWSHTRPNGTHFTTVFQDYGFGCGGSAENLIHTSGGEDAATLVARWMGSENNRSSLMSSGFSTVGIGVYYANGVTYIACLLVG